MLLTGFPPFISNDRPAGDLSAQRLVLMCVILVWFVLFSSVPGWALSLKDFFAFPPVVDCRIEVPADRRPAWFSLWMEARRQVRLTDYAAARDLYARVIEQQPASLRIRQEYGGLLLAMGMYDDAATQFEMLLEQFPDEKSLLNGLGYIMLEKGYYERANELFERTLLHDPGNIIALTALAELVLAQGAPEGALRQFEALAQIVKDDLDVRRKLVRLSYDLGLIAKARPLALSLAERPEATLMDLLMAARTLDEPGLEEKAALYWKKVLAISPVNREAHAWLASFFEGQGQWRQALDHVHFLSDVEPENAKLLLRLGDCYQNLHAVDKAASCYERYLALVPGDKSALAKLLALSFELEEGVKTLDVLDRCLRADVRLAPELLKKAAVFCEKAGRAGDAMVLYRRLLGEASDDTEILAGLARTQLAMGAEEEALQTLSRQALLAPESTAVYRSMLPLLLRRDDPNQLLFVLGEINKKEPQDIEVALRLSSILAERGRRKDAERVFLPVAGKRVDTEKLLRMRAGLYDRLAMPEHALNDYLALARLQEGGPEVRRMCLEYAAVLGRLEELPALLDAFWADQPGQEEILRVADRFRDGADFDRALSLYRQLLGQARDSGLKRRVLFSLAVLYEHLDLPYEAEQVLREALIEGADSMDGVERVVDLLVRGGRPREAATWLEALRETTAEKSRVPRDHWRITLLEARIYNAEGEFPAARRQLVELLQTMAGQESSMAREAGLELAAALLGLGEYAEAEKQCRLVLQSEEPDYDGVALLQRILAAGDEHAKAEELYGKVLDEAGRDLGRMIRLTEAYRRAGVQWAVERTSKTALDMAPWSFFAAFQRAVLLAELGEPAQALDLLGQLASRVPSHSAIETLIARISFAMGIDERAMAACDSLLSRQPYRPDIQLLKARVLWRHLDWENSLSIYDNFLVPAVEDLFAKQALSEGVDAFSARKISVWQRLTFSDPDASHLIDDVMLPSFLMMDHRTGLKEIATPLYSRYRWQRRFALELAARRYVEQRDDFQAVHLFQELLEAYPDDDSLLFDLAGIYSRLGRLGDEALLYERLATRDSAYPGLEKARERNSLKRLPRVVPSFRYANEEGRDGYKSMRKSSYQIASWMSPQPGNDLAMTLSRIRYGSADSSTTLWAKRAMASYAKKMFERFDISLGGGVESLDGGDVNTALVACELNGKVGDRIQGNVSYERDVVEDTVASLSRNVVEENVSAGVMLGLLPRLLTGGNYDFMNFSDGNDRKGYTVWASYIVFPEPTYLQLKFSYDFTDAREGNDDSGPLLDDGFSGDDHPYWTPRNYWKNGYGILWKHKLSADTLERGTPSYYSAEYLLEYDSNGHMSQTFRGLFSLELNRNWMLESEAQLVLSDGYRARDISLSATYRW